MISSDAMWICINLLTYYLLLPALIAPMSRALYFWSWLCCALTTLSLMVNVAFWIRNHGS